MRPTNPAMGSAMPGPKTYIGWWGDMHGPKQKGVVSYTMSPWKQKPLAGVLHGYIFNGFKRIMIQVPYWVIPFSIAYGAVSWGNKKYAYYNSKVGHHEAHMAEHGGH